MIVRPGWEAGGVGKAPASRYGRYGLFAGGVDWGPVREPARAPGEEADQEPLARSLDRGTHDWDLMLASLMAIWAVGGAVFVVLIVATDPPPELARSWSPSCAAT